MDQPPTLLLTRPDAQSARFAKACRARFGRHFPIVIAPLMRIELLPCEPVPDWFKGVIFTSENAINAALPGNGPAYCVGPHTAAVARKAGYDATAAEGDAESLITMLEHMRPATPLLHLRGEHARGNVATRLRRVGVITEERIVYRQLPEPLSDAARGLLEGDVPVILPLFSPRSAELFVRAAANVHAPLLVVAISPAVEAVAKGSNPAKIVTSDQPSADAMLDALAGLMDA